MNNDELSFTAHLFESPELSYLELIGEIVSSDATTDISDNFSLLRLP
jgi:hypothetical protein